MSNNARLLGGILIVGLLLQFFNLSPFTVYPDSFQNVIVAANIKAYGSVTGFLGPHGMFYPDFFMWTRPLFPLLINVIATFGLPPLIAARCIAFVFGILAIPIAYLLVKKVFPANGNTFGLIAATLLAFSYNHTVWSGLVMTESIGVFCMLVFLWQFFSTSAKATGFLSVQTIVTGFLFAVAVLARYEYSIIAVPVVLYVIKKSPQPRVYLTTVFGTSFLCLLLSGFILYPVQSVFQVLVQQMSGLVFKTVLVVVVLVGVFILNRFIPKKYRNKFVFMLPHAITILLGFLFLVFVLLLIFHQTSIFGIDVTMFTDFFKHDFLLSLFAFIGLVKMLDDTKELTRAYFVLVSLALLGYMYYQINPEMERYMTHLIPFLLIPASYGIVYFFRTAFINQTQHMRIFLRSVFLVVVFGQIIISLFGFRNLNDPSWFEPSYQEMAARLTGKYVSGNPLLLTSLPEPYYYFLHLDTQSIADTYPYLYIPPSENKRTVVIVEDMGMRDVFPNFTRVLDTKLQNYRIASFWVHERYHSANHSVAENSPVILYSIQLDKLRKLLK